MTTHSASILVIEDEAAIQRGLCDLLAYHGHRPTGVSDGAEGLAAALQGTFALCIVDAMLPGVDGFQIVREVRAAYPNQALMMLTARGREEDVLAGFEAGCDDYITKPFSVAQLMARVDALLRRVPSKVQSNRIGELELDVGNLQIRSGDESRAVSQRDIEILQFLFQHRHRIVSRAELLQEVWGYARVEGVETRAVDMHLVKLRRKLEGFVSADFIETVRGAGYRMRVPS